MAKMLGKKVVKRLRYKNRKVNDSIVEEVVEVAPIVDEQEVDNQIPEVVEEPTPVVEEVIEEPTPEVVEEIADDKEEPVESENLDEVPLEMKENEMQAVLDEEGSLDGSVEEVEELASEEIVEETEEGSAPEMVEDVVEEVVPVEPEIVEEVVEEVVPVEPEIVEEIVEEPAPVVEEVVEEPTPVVEEVVEEPAPVVEEVVEEPTPVVEEVVEETIEEPAPAVVEEVVEDPTPVAPEVVDEVAITQVAEETETEDEDEEEKEEVEVADKPKKDEFALTAPADLEDILSRICTKRARKLIYRPGDVIFSHTTTVLGTDKTNDEKIKIKNILDAEIKQGVKLGYLDKFDGLKMSELKEEYENDIVYEYADQEFKRTGILLDGDKVKVYVYDWDMKACHHVGYIDDESANLVKPYLVDSEKYSFDINGIIVGGKYKKITKDEKTGKITVEKGNDGNLGLEIDINIINRKD